jgi:hypothetical protein
MSTDEGILNRRKGRKRRERRQSELRHQECDSQLGCLFSGLRILSILLILSKNFLTGLTGFAGLEMDRSNFAASFASSPFPLFPPVQKNEPAVHVRLTEPIVVQMPGARYMRGRRMGKRVSRGRRKNIFLRTVCRAAQIARMLGNSRPNSRFLANRIRR